MKRLLTVVSVVALLLSMSYIAAADDQQREGTQGSGNTFGAASHLTVADIADALLTDADSPCLVDLAVTAGADEQLEVPSESGAGFPGGGYLLMSSGDATLAVPGTAAGTFLTINHGAFEGVLPVTSGGSPTGHTTIDRASLQATFFIPNGASSLDVDWKLGSEEPPTFYQSVFQDYFTAILDGSTVMDQTWVDHNIDVLGANLPGGSSDAPTPPFPNPDDTAYNSTTPAVQTASANVTGSVGGNVTVDLHVADASDGNLDSGVFLDNLGLDQCLWEVEIDIKPGSDPNAINVRARGVIPVAILTTDTFDAASVDPASVCFGDADAPGERDCTEAHGTGHLEDADGDGDTDLVLHFETRETGIDAGDTEGCLTGTTFGGIPIEGCDSILTVPVM